MSITNSMEEAFLDPQGSAWAGDVGTLHGDSRSRVSVSRTQPKVIFSANIVVDGGST
jgi:hypothetical protein